MAKKEVQKLELTQSDSGWKEPVEVTQQHIEFDFGLQERLEAQWARELVEEKKSFRMNFKNSCSHVCECEKLKYKPPVLSESVMRSLLRFEKGMWQREQEKSYNDRQEANKNRLLPFVYKLQLSKLNRNIIGQK